MNGYLAILKLDLKRFWLDRARLIFSCMQPLLYLFVLGSGLGSSTRLGNDAYLTYIFPGVVSLALLFTATFAAIAIVFDRQVGFLRAVLVAPVPRWTIAFGKITSGALQGLMQGLVLLIFSPLAGIHFTPFSFFAFVGTMVIAAITFSALGIAVAARFRSVTVFPVVSNAMLMPMFFLSGGLYPLDSAPAWLQAVAQADPVAYAVDLMRAAITGHHLFSIQRSLITLGLFVTAVTILAVQVFQRGEDS